MSGDELPRSMSATVNVSTMSDEALQHEYVALTRWYARNYPEGCGLAMTEAMRAAHDALVRVQDEMHRRNLARLARCSVAQHQAAAVSARRSQFARNVQGDPEYRSLVDPAAGANVIGYYWVRSYCDGLFSVRCVPALEKVYDLEGRLVWMNEAGMSRPLVDPVSVVVGAVMPAALGAPTLTNLALEQPVQRGIGVLASRAAVGMATQTATQAARNSAIRFGQGVLTPQSVVIPRGVLQQLRATYARY